jgi:hypothetical protein
LELTNAGQHEHNLTLSMLKIHLAAGGTDNEDHRFSLRGLKSKLEDELLAIGCMDKAQADRHMVAKKLHCKDANAVATKAYRMQFDRGEWPAPRPPHLGTVLRSQKARSGAVLRRKSWP